MSRLTRDGTSEPVSRDQSFRRERGQGKFHFPFPADHEQDWQPYPVDPYSCYMCDHTYTYLPLRRQQSIYSTKFSCWREFKFPYIELLYCKACVNSEGKTTLFAVSDKRKGIYFLNDIPRTSGSTANSDNTLPKSNTRFK